MDHLPQIKIELLCAWRLPVLLQRDPINHQILQRSKRQQVIILRTTGFFWHHVTFSQFLPIFLIFSSRPIFRVIFLIFPVSGYFTGCLRPHATRSWAARCADFRWRTWRAASRGTSRTRSPSPATGSQCLPARFHSSLFFLVLKNKVSEKPFSLQVPKPRPGRCYNQSTTLPESSLHFIKNHCLMDAPVPSRHNNKYNIYMYNNNILIFICITIIY